MKQVLVEFDERTLAELEKVAPARSRRRSEFIRGAVQRALWALEEEKTAEAYARLPDDEPAFFEPDVWEPVAQIRKKKAKARRRDAK